MQIGQVFGRLTVIRRADEKRKWLCRCVCGTEKSVHSGNLWGGRTTNCGCIKVVHVKHAEASNGRPTKRYNSWRSMKDRCYNKNDEKYYLYGAQGITICQRWLDSYEAFAEDMGAIPQPEKDYSLDRIDNSGNYEPGNCRWATNKQQARNRTTNRYLTFKGETLTLAEWAERTGIKQDTLGMRLNRSKWSIEKALTTPVGYRYG